MSAQHVITVDPPAAPTVSLPSGLPASLDCARERKSAVQGESVDPDSGRGTSEKSGTLSPSVTNAFDACSGGTITIDYGGTDESGDPLSA